MRFPARRGVTRVVVFVGRYAVKVPRRGYVVRGWLANRSEWKQRRRPDVARPLLTLAHVVLVMPRGEPLSPGAASELAEHLAHRRGDEAKPCSWAHFDPERVSVDGLFLVAFERPVLLVDYDRAWQRPGRGIVGGLYYGRQERLARRWMRLPAADAQGEA